MSNQKSMAEIHSIEALHASGHSNREIARLLSIDRGTVNKYVARLAERQQAEAVQNQPNAPPGSSTGPTDNAVAGAGPNSESESPLNSHPEAAQNRPNAPTGSEAVNRPAHQPRKSGSASQCEPYREQIQQKLEQGLSATKIHQDLKREHGEF